MKTVVGIRRVGKQEVFDLSVKKNHNFITRGAILHNCDYRGELCVIGENTNGSLDFVVEVGERIGQLVLQRVPQIVWDPVMSKEDLDKTDRAGGFGSTGTK